MRQTRSLSGAALVQCRAGRAVSWERAYVETSARCAKRRARGVPVGFLLLTTHTPGQSNSASPQ
jgi:hypothetical protein